jgi:YD repeat-containing protein
MKKIVLSILLIVSFILPISSASACSLQFTSPQRGSTVFNSHITISGNGSGTANPGAIGTVTATVNGAVFFQQTGQFTSLINFFGSGSASVDLHEGLNIISVNGSAAGCSAEDSMVIFYEPQINQPEKEAGKPEQCTGNPINTATGNKYQVEPLYHATNSFIQPLNTVYNSQLANIDNGIGFGWSFISLKHIISDGSTLRIEDGSGKSEVFIKSGSAWQGDPDTQLIIEQSASGYSVKMPRGMVDNYNLQGQLISHSSPQGQATTYQYGDLGLMSLITGPYGQQIMLSYDAAAHLSKVTNPEGQAYLYHYDIDNNLISISYPDDTPLDDTDNPTREYHYEDTSFPHHLTGITDETGTRYVTWTYDSEGRAISSEHAGGVDRSTLDFSIADQVTVTNPLGKDTTYHFTTLHGVKKVTQVEGHQTASCAGANQAYTYDANGYIESKTDWQGNVTTYIHDARGLETSRTEAFGTPQARTTLTEWHPDFRLPVKITEPNQVTDFVYDAQGRVLSQTTSPVQP